METSRDSMTLLTQNAKNDVESTHPVQEATEDNFVVHIIPNGADKAHKRLWDSDCDESKTKKRECLHSSTDNMSDPITCTRMDSESIPANGNSNYTQISNIQNKITSIQTGGETTTSLQVLPIERSVDLSIPQLPPWERYFTKRIVDDICLLIHSNRIAVVTLLPSHPILCPGRVVTSVDFAKRADNAVRGKGKRGAQALKVDSALCEVTCNDGTKYTVRACIGGKLIEVNARLMKTPELLSKRPQSEGYIAIMMPYDTKNKHKDKRNDDVIIETEGE